MFMAKFALVHVIIVIYHTIPLHMGNHTDSCQLVPFLNNLLVMKMVTVGDLCLTYVILFI